MIKLLFTTWRRAKKDQIENGKHYGGKHGEYFRCAWCGESPKEEEEYNVVLTNNLDIDVIIGNPIVCKYCYDLYGNNLLDELRDRVHELFVIHEKRYWWFLRRK